MRGKGGDIKLKNELDLDLIDEDDLLKEMFDMEQAAKQSMQDLMDEQALFESKAQKDMQKTVKQIRLSIK